MKQIYLILLVLLAAAVMVTGCTSPQPAAQPIPVTTPVATPVVTSAPSVPTNLAGQWTLTTLGIQGGTAVIYPTYGITLTLNNDDSLTGYDGCNNYFGSFALSGMMTPKGEGMTVSDISVSDKYCETLADQEQEYLAILGKTEAWVVDTTQLTLTASNGDVLIYQRPETLVTPAEGPQPA